MTKEKNGKAGIGARLAVFYVRNVVRQVKIKYSATLILKINLLLLQLQTHLNIIVIYL